MRGLERRHAHQHQQGKLKTAPTKNDHHTTRNAPAGANLAKNMNIEDFENRIASLERSNQEAQESMAGMVELNRALIDFQKMVFTQLFKWMAALDNRHGEALQLVKETLPGDEDRRKLGDILARSVFDRDQLEAMIRKIESLPSSNPPTPPGS